MKEAFEKLDITFDENNKTIISKAKLFSIIQKAKLGDIFSEYNQLPSECYLLVDDSLKDFYPFPLEELTEWENDGSFESGDSLYKIKLIRKY